MAIILHHTLNNWVSPALNQGLLFQRVWQITRKPSQSGTFYLAGQLTQLENTLITKV